MNPLSVQGLKRNCSAAKYLWQTGRIRPKSCYMAGAGLWNR